MPGKLGSAMFPTSRQVVAVSGYRTPQTLNDIVSVGPQSLRGGGHGGHGGGHPVTHHDLTHHYDERTLKQRQQASLREKIVNTIRIVTGLGTLGTIAFCYSL